MTELTQGIFSVAKNVFYCHCFFSWIVRSRTVCYTRYINAQAWISSDEADEEDVWQKEDYDEYSDDDIGEIVINNISNDSSQEQANFNAFHLDTVRPKMS